MPVSIGPTKLTCKDCGFSKVIPVQGDVVLMPSVCEKCDGANLIRGRASLLASVLLKIQRVLKR